MDMIAERHPSLTQDAAIRKDPEWKNGNYDKPPQGFLSIMPMFDMLVPQGAPEGMESFSEMLQDMILAAINEANRKVDEAMKGKLGGMLPPGLGGLFG